jgi:hypothetical protein
LRVGHPKVPKKLISKNKLFFKNFVEGYPQTPHYPQRNRATVAAIDPATVAGNVTALERRHRVRLPVLLMSHRAAKSNRERPRECPPALGGGHVLTEKTLSNTGSLPFSLRIHGNRSQMRATVAADRCRNHGNSAHLVGFGAKKPLKRISPLHPPTSPRRR